ncbi:MAG: hypothetical protein LBP75_02970 [Planctomycetota bacterium]|jgi:hypothetical protein|nr:hypothetical protein [Planctomycetota bacterium]
MLTLKREFFPRVKKTIMPRPPTARETDVLGQSGTVYAGEAQIYGDNWYFDKTENLIEIYGAGAALVFRNLLPRPHKYAREGLYLQLTLAYRTTENACANIRNFSGNHVNLPNSVAGALFTDPNTYYWVTDDLTVNINSLYTGEKLWLQRVDWEWVSREVIYDDELTRGKPFLNRTPEQVAERYRETVVTEETARKFLIDRINNDADFAKRCLGLLHGDRLREKDLVAAYQELRV